MNQNIYTIIIFIIRKRIKDINFYIDHWILKTIFQMQMQLQLYIVKYNKVILKSTS